MYVHNRIDSKIKLFISSFFRLLNNSSSSRKYVISFEGGRRKFSCILKKNMIKLVVVCSTLHIIIAFRSASKNFLTRFACIEFIIKWRNFFLLAFYPISQRFIKAIVVFCFWWCRGGDKKWIKCIFKQILS